MSYFQNPVGTVNVRVYNIKGIKFMDYVEQTEEDIPLHIDIKNLRERLCTDNQKFNYKNH